MSLSPNKDKPKDNEGYAGAKGPADCPFVTGTKNERIVRGTG